MIEQLDELGGQKWARLTLMGALAVSIGYNVANICLTVTSVHVLLRIPQGIVWPLFLFLGIEVMIRNKDLTSRLAKLARLSLMGVTVPTAITSYINLHDFMVKAHEPGIAQVTGPLAIDGLMLGCTLYLLASRFQPTIGQEEQAPEPLPTPVLTLQYATPIGPMPAPAPVLPATPAPLPEQSERTERAPRSSSWDAALAAEMAVDGAKASEIAEKVGVSPATAGLFVKVAKMLRADPRAEIPSKVTGRSVNPEYVRMMREQISR